MNELKDAHRKTINKQLVTDIILLTIFWLTISPLMLTVYNNKKYLKKWAIILAIIISPLSLFVLPFLIVGVDLGIEVINILNESQTPVDNQSTDPWLVSIAQVIVILIQAACDMIVIGVAKCTGWNINETAVYICEYFAPLSCTFIALIVALIILSKFGKMDKYGKCLSLIPLSVEIYQAWHHVQIYLAHKATYAGMSIDSIFQTSKDSLIQMAVHHYILANTYDYILPMIIILLTGFIAKIIYNRRRKIPAPCHPQESQIACDK
ncbi:MAG: hypothetical protein K2L35_05890 [Muribaculaceae bacterium]|nr:hypothetical protein [Muribaculaceae bacterium]